MISILSAMSVITFQLKFPVIFIHPIEAENNFLLECSDSKLVMYYRMNTTFVNYLDTLDNLTDSLKFPILLNRTTYKQTLPISLKSFEFDSELLKAPKTLKDLFTSFIMKRKLLICKKAYQ